MDPNKNTRREWTEYGQIGPVPDDAAEDWKTRLQNIKDLHKQLAYHPAMAPNIDQTYMTPAASKNKVYFMWDFVGRTMQYIYAVPPTLQGMSEQEKQAWDDVRSRNFLAAQLILDTKPGMLDQMVDQTYPGQGDRPQFGDEILETARKLAQ